MHDPRRVLSVDPSLRSSGWALFDLNAEQLLSVGKVGEKQSSRPMSERLASLQGKISLLFEHLEIGERDILVVESATTMRDPRAVLLVEQVRTMFETIARSRQALVPGRIHPRTVHFELLGLRGKQLGREIVKSSARSTVRNLQGSRLEQLGINSGEDSLQKHQDIVDAVLIGTLAVDRVQSSKRTGVPVSTFFTESRQGVRS